MNCLNIFLPYKNAWKQEKDKRNLLISKLNLLSNRRKLKIRDAKIVSISRLLEISRVLEANYEESERCIFNISILDLKFHWLDVVKEVNNIKDEILQIDRSLVHFFEDEEKLIENFFEKIQKCTKDIPIKKISKVLNSIKEISQGVDDIHLIDNILDAVLLFEPQLRTGILAAVPAEKIGRK